jgi:hypothetical protein
MTLETPYGYCEKVADENEAVKILKDGYEGELRRVVDSDGSVLYERYALGQSGWEWQFAGRVYLDHEVAAQ